MTNAEVITLIMRRLGGRRATELRTLVVQEFNAKVKELEVAPVLPFFCEDEYTVNLAAGAGYFQLPNDFSREVEEAPLRLTSPEGHVQFPRKVRYDQLTKVAATDSGSSV
jgi:hypothetical protein